MDNVIYFNIFSRLHKRLHNFYTNIEASMIVRYTHFGDNNFLFYGAKKSADAENMIKELLA